MSIVRESPVLGVRFGLLSPEAIRRTSVVKVTSRDTYVNNEPFIGPMHDLDLPALTAGAGFAQDKVIYTTAPSARRAEPHGRRRRLPLAGGRGDDAGRLSRGRCWC